VVVSSAKSEFVDCARERAMNIVAPRAGVALDDDIIDIAKNLIQSKKIVIQEYAKLIDNTVRVCIDGDLDDDDVKFRALDMIYSAIDNGGVWFSGVDLTYNVEDLPELAVI
jgi:hypothetical protein